MGNELCVNGFSAVSEKEMTEVDGGTVCNKAQVIVGAVMTASSLSVACCVAMVLSPSIAIAAGVACACYGIGLMCKGTGN